MPTGKQICEKQLLKVIDDLEKVKVNGVRKCRDFMTDIYRKLDRLSKEDRIKTAMNSNQVSPRIGHRGRDEIETANWCSCGKARSGERGASATHRSSRKSRTLLYQACSSPVKWTTSSPNELISLLNNNTHVDVWAGTNWPDDRKVSLLRSGGKRSNQCSEGPGTAPAERLQASVEAAGDEGKWGSWRGKREVQPEAMGKKDLTARSAAGWGVKTATERCHRQTQRKGRKSLQNDKKKKSSSREEWVTQSSWQAKRWLETVSSRATMTLRMAEPDFSS